MKKHNFRFIMGKNSIRELIKAAPQRIVEIYTCAQDDSFLDEIKKHRISVHHVSKKELSQLVDSESHQSYVAAIKEKGTQNLDDFLEQDKKTGLVVMLDSIYDPQNLGAILRACECFGVDLVLFSKNRGTDITPVVSKTSSGATELIPIIKVSNLAETLKPFQEAGYWVVTAEGESDSQSIYEFDFPEKTFIIMGSEGEGVQKLLSKRADFHVKIPMLGKIDSLNVSQATAVFLSFYRRKFLE